MEICNCFTDLLGIERGGYPPMTAKIASADAIKGPLAFVETWSPGWKGC